MKQRTDIIDSAALSELRERIRLLSEIDLLEHWNALSFEIFDMIEKVDSKIENSPQLCDDIKKDIRYLLGRRSAFKDVLALPTKKRGQNKGGE
jgi:hypothetical protein